MSFYAEQYGLVVLLQGLGRSFRGLAVRPCAEEIETKSNEMLDFRPAYGSRTCFFFFILFFIFIFFFVLHVRAGR